MKDLDSFYAENVKSGNTVSGVMLIDTTEDSYAFTTHPDLVQTL